MLLALIVQLMHATRSLLKTFMHPRDPTTPRSPRTACRPLNPNSDQLSSRLATNISMFLMSYQKASEQGVVSISAGYCGVDTYMPHRSTVNKNLH